jgi:hypothetical protein
MQDSKVRNILTKVKGMSNAGQSPVPYIDGVLDTIDAQPTVETTEKPKKALFAANYGNPNAKALF